MDFWNNQQAYLYEQLNPTKTPETILTDPVLVWTWVERSPETGAEVLVHKPLPGSLRHDLQGLDEHLKFSTSFRSKSLLWED